MSDYFFLKTLHIISAAVLFGTGIGIAYFKWTVDRSGNVAAIRAVSERVVLADWLFTSTAIVVQPITGFALAQLAGYSIMSRWIFYSLVLYAIAGVCWLPVVALQLRMRSLARSAEEDGGPLDARYWHLSRAWLWLGVPAFSCLIAIFWLMVAKPL